MKKRVIRTVLLVLVLLIGGYMVELAIPKQDYFIERAGSVGASTVEVTAGGEFIDEYVSLESTSGLTAELRVRRPVDGERVPVLLVLGGYDTGKNAVELAGAPNGVAFAALDYPYDGEESLSGWHRMFTAIPDVQQAFLDSPAVMMLAVDWLDAQPWVERVELIGASLGVPFTAVAGALDERFSRIWLLHGGGDNGAWVEHAAKSEIKNGALRSIVGRSILFLCYGNSFDTDEWVLRTAPRDVVIVMAKDDDFVPPDAQQAFVDIGDREHVEIIWTEGRHIMPGRPDELGQLLNVVLERVADPALAPDRE